jgi:hypothetical protein
VVVGLVDSAGGDGGCCGGGPTRPVVRGEDVVSHTGSVITRMLVDKTGLTGALSDALYRPDVFHDRGAVMRDLAV